MENHKCYIDEKEVGFNLETGEKDFYCPICQKIVMVVKVK